MNQSVSWNAIKVLNVAHFLFKRVYTLLFPRESGENKITFVLIGCFFPLLKQEKGPAAPV